MALENALVIADVAHARQRPKRNAFHYHVYYLCLSLDLLPLLGKLAVFSLKHFHLFGLRERDYGHAQTAKEYIRSVLGQWNMTQADGDVVLLTMPRVLGYAFNPISLWYCLDKTGNLRAVLADVSNTFGERHGYLLFHDDQRPIGPDDWMRSEKIFHVSPFIKVNGHYEFRFKYSDEAIGVWINHHDADGLLITTSLVGKRSQLSSRTLLRNFFRYPLVTLKVITLIHYQALKLTFKGIHYLVKPNPPLTEISR